MKSADRPRAGMTLVELLVVMSIIAILGSLVTAGVMGWLNSQSRRNTEAGLKAINIALKAHWEAVVNDARKESIPLKSYTAASTNPKNYNTAVFPTDVKEFSKDSGGIVDEERARVIWIKLRLMEAFPVNFDEIDRAYKNDLASPTSTSVFPNPLVLIPPERRRYMANYREMARPRVVPSTPNPQTESAACLFMALSTNHAGVGHNLDILKPYSGDVDNDGMSELVDGYGEPFRFYRFAWNNDALQNFGKTLPAQKHLSIAGEYYYDPLDPKGRLIRGTTSGALWNTVNATSFFDQRVHTRLKVTPPVGSTTPAEPWYATPVIVSCGPDRNLGLMRNVTVGDMRTDDGAMPYQNMGIDPDPGVPSRSLDEKDNVYSYNLK